MDTNEPKKDEKVDNKNTKENDEAEEKKGENLSEEDKKKFLDELNKMKLESVQRKKGEIKDKYKFWEEQPVPQFSKDIGVEFGPINKDCKVENERKEPYPLPAGFEWKDVDVRQFSPITPTLVHGVFLSKLHKRHVAHIRNSVLQRQRPFC